MSIDSSTFNKIYNVFDSANPLPAGDAAYMNCDEVRNSNISRAIGRPIKRSDQPRCQLYAGHRGGGKSTELLRLCKELEDAAFRVVYFAAHENDIEPEDVSYTDILLACTRHLLDALKDDSDPKPVLNWLQGRLKTLKNLLTTELDIEFENLGIEAQIAGIANISGNLRLKADTRQQVRQQLDDHTPSLLKVLSEFIDNARETLPATKLVLVVDSLDRIVPQLREGGRSNLEEIFIDRSEQLRSLPCHVIYTIPISMLYSEMATHLSDRYGSVEVLPMVMVWEQTPERLVYEKGLKTLHELVAKRLRKVAPTCELTTVFAEEVLDRLCRMSGGHMRDLVHLIHTAMDYVDDLPITLDAANSAISKTRDVYRNAVNEEDWMRLAHVYCQQEIPNNEDYRKLLYNRSILAYKFDNRSWYDVHPLIVDIEQFQRALQVLRRKS